MARPRLRTADELLDAAEALVVDSGRGGLTVRALSARTGASNGSVYHAFGDLESLLASTWLRRARQYLALLRQSVDADLLAGEGRRAVLAAADTPARLAEQDLRAARLLTALTRDDVLTDGVAEPVASDLRALDQELGEVLRALARAVRDRAGRAAVDVVTTCVVRLPAALLFPEIRAGRVRSLARRQLAAAVGAVLDTP
ncbi:TetR/AcrR family transcriptional regulator [Blastococcus sp. TBT05-19]|uniref:TetR/AcrR family transcriptional regulator n=1 Tax=Blastococcus sp. TBT05-19 TaxID=2250581 RepID=UPI000DEA31EA|nr:TetR/AcrR family transcriptional regulator [Blastococcus sp. TBT05-19]RBY91463.1 TetR/AcrR family transcriptional regulator [Blastococcus sp. TBT05-19]